MAKYVNAKLLSKFIMKMKIKMCALWCPREIDTHVKNYILHLVRVCLCA